MATLPNYFIDAGGNPFQSALSEGMKFGATMQDLQAAQLQRQQQQQAAALKLQQDQQALAAQEVEQQRRIGIQQRLSTKRPQDYNRLDTIDLMSLYDKDTQSAAKSIFEQLPEEGRKQQVKTLGGIASAIRGGNVDAAKQLMQQQIDANKEVDPEEAQQYTNLLQTLEKNPDTVFQTMIPLLSVAGKEGQEALTSILGAEKTGAETRKLAAEGVIKEAESKFAPQMAQATYQKLLTDTEVAKQNARVNAMNAQISRESNNLKRQELELKVQEARQKMDSTIREKAAEIDTARTSMDNMLNTADRILSTPKSVVGSAAGPVSSRIPTTTQSTADFEALVETLGSQAFMAQIPNLKGMGALSNAEGEKLQAALQNFSLKQSPEQLLRNVKEAQRLILKARTTLANRYGVEENLPDRPAMPTNVAPAAGQRNVTVDY
jgi:hypothetical protein